MRALIAILLLGALSSVASADEISARLDPGVIYGDEAVRVVVEIGEVKGTITGLDLTVPEGFRVERWQEAGRRTTVANGRRRDVVSYAAVVTPPAGRKGRFSLGPLVVTKGSGEKSEVAVGDLLIGRRPPPGLRLTAEVVPPRGPVMAPFLVRYRLLYSGERYESRDLFARGSSPFGFRSLGLAVLDRRDLEVTPVATPGEASVGTLRTEGGTEILLHQGVAEEEDGVYRTLSFSFEVTPLTAEPVDLSARVRMAVVTGTERVRDVWRRLVDRPKIEEFAGSTGAVRYEVSPLPEEGKPAGFTGAVGRFTIEASPAVREANAYDPIDVTVTISGTGLLDGLVLPRWSEFPDIAREFELAADVDPGTVEGETKRFRVVFRARSSTVTRLPPLPFPYYDAWKGSYETAWSEAVPLTIRDVRTVRPEASIGASAPIAAEAAPVARLGVGANFEDPGETTDAVRARPPLFTAGFLVVLALPPLLVVLALALAAWRAKPRDAPRGAPLGRALRVLEGGVSVDEAAAAWATYFREKLDLGEGEVTTRELGRALAARVVPPALAARAEETNELLTASRFAGGGEVPGGLTSLLREVDRCLD